jgi:hypothetical protein
MTALSGRSVTLGKANGSADLSALAGSRPRGGQVQTGQVFGQEKELSIPRPVLAKVSKIVSEFHTAKQLDYVLDVRNCPKPLNEGTNKYDKVYRHLMEAARTDGYDAARLLGSLLEAYMDDDLSGRYEDESITRQKKGREEIQDVLKEHGFAYRVGGSVVPSTVATPTRALDDFLRDRDLASIEEAFRRAEKNVDADPPAALDAACSIVEACCRVYIEEHPQLSMPSDKSIKHLYKVVQADLGWDPSSKEDDDMKRILGGLTSIVDGVGAFRTRAGAAHGRGKTRYRVQPRHARLAVHAAHTLVLMILETWEAKEPRDRS